MGGEQASKWHQHEVRNHHKASSRALPPPLIVYTAVMFEDVNFYEHQIFSNVKTYEVLFSQVRSNSPSQCSYTHFFIMHHLKGAIWSSVWRADQLEFTHKRHLTLTDYSWHLVWNFFQCFRNKDTEKQTICQSSINQSISKNK